MKVTYIHFEETHQEVETDENEDGTFYLQMPLTSESVNTDSENKELDDAGYIQSACVDYLDCELAIACACNSSDVVKLCETYCSSISCDVISVVVDDEWIFRLVENMKVKNYERVTLYEVLTDDVELRRQISNEDKKALDENEDKAKSEVI